ncbi:hypothetical protein PP175_26110 (plasmid) [Aneurinibacillus sp. Ricciae_BoGa-3]|uniref:hypothetical protein n=1 Tax=Aneurinibacillus sp. Ricciae_BoGa-3 TaxID=3022697 RepID=UPI00233FCA0E|nr:hypothetical protein [Aneurinibacillus sp. Ricciae_BoGa-3]WCK57542.1 hypothetical protein PP175_26110 [Aneurinibacillus sp. Ricciae_BoGa-3]
MDNQVFNVNGRDWDDLASVLKLAFKLSGKKARAFRIDKKKGLVLYWSENVTGSTALVAPMDGEQIFPTVKAFLMSEKAEIIELDKWDKNLNHDGSNAKGWRVYTEDWGHVNEDHYAFLAITPAYMWYGK